MTLAPQPSSPAAAADPGLSRQAWITLALLAVLFLALHGPAILVNSRIAQDDSNWSHIFIVPFISLYLVWQQWPEVRQTPVRTCWWALPFLIFGITTYLIILEIGRVTPLAVFTIFNLGALILFLGGIRLARKLAMPVAYLLFAVPSDLLFQPLSSVLQGLAARGSNVLLNVLGTLFDIEAERLGNTLQLYHHGLSLQPPLNIAEACRGLRMLMAFAALGTAMAYLMREQPRWVRFTLMASTIPIAVIANILRITGMGLAYPWHPGVTSGDLHGVLGLLMLVPAVGLFLLLEWLLPRLWIPVDKAEKWK